MSTLRKLVGFASVFAALSSFGAFKYQTTFTVNGYYDTTTLEDFPVLVRLSSEKINGFDYDLLQADGKDIQFTSADGNTIYPHEIDEWNTGDGEESLVWVRVPLSSGMTFKMNFGDPSIDTPPVTSTDGTVWKNSGYFAVYHLGETADIGTKDFRAADATENRISLKPVVSASTCVTMVSQEGVVGRGVRNLASDSTEKTSLAGLTSYKNIGSATSFTVSGWVKVLKQVNGTGIFQRKTRPQGAGGWNILLSGAKQFTFYGGNNYVGAAVINAMNCADSVVGKYVYLTFMHDGADVSLYVDGIYEGQGTAGLAPTDNDVPFHIGGGDFSYDNFLPMVADEVRLRNGNSSEEWIRADYYTQATANFVTASAVEELVVEGNTITVTATPEELPVEGVTYGPDQPIVPGAVTFTASPAMQTQGNRNYRVLGWNLTVYGAGGTVTKTSGDGCSCAFTHADGETEKLEWILGEMFAVTATSSDVSRGTVTGGGYYDENTNVTVTATALPGFEFVKWVSSDVPAADIHSPTVTLPVTKPLTLQAVFSGKRYQWNSPVAGTWTVAENWLNEEIPPNDGSADVVFPGGTADYIVTIPKITISVRSLSVTAPTAEANNKHVILSGGTVEIGEGGISYDDAAYSCGFEFRSSVVKITASQTWLLTSAKNQTALYLNNVTLHSAEGTVWTVAGKSGLTFNGGSCKNVKGNVRINTKLFWYGATAPLFQDVEAPGSIELYDAAEPIAGSLAGVTYPDMTSSNENHNVLSAPVSLNLTKSLEFGFSRSTYIKDNAWRYRVASTITGQAPAKGLVFSTGSATLMTHFPFKQYVTLACDLTGLTNDWISLSQGVFVLDGAEAVGDRGISFGNAAAGGYLAGLLTKDGIDVPGDLELTPQNAHVILGLADEGTATYSGAVTTSGLAANKKTQLHLYAPKDATVNMTGDFGLSDANNLPVVVRGGGTVALSGDNAAMNRQGVIVRSASLVLGSSTAAGTQAISLGDQVPGETTVRALLDTSLDYVGGSWQYYKITSAGGVWTITKNLPFQFDGLTLAAGDRFFHSPNNSAAGCIYEMTSDSTFVAVTNIIHAEGLRIHVAEGNAFGGKTVYLTRGTTALEDVANPDVKVLAKNGVTITNDIIVTDNLSTGISAIGSADASAVTFSGTITFGKDTFFEAAPGSTVNVTGDLVNDGDFNIGFSGLGTVNFANVVDVAGRDIIVRIPVSQIAKDDRTRYTLATGLTGRPSRIVILDEAGEPLPEDHWSVYCLGGRLFFHAGRLGTLFLIN